MLTTFVLAAAAVCFLFGALKVSFSRHDSEFTPEWLNAGMFFLTVGLFLLA